MLFGVLTSRIFGRLKDLISYQHYGSVFEENHFVSETLEASHVVECIEKAKQVRNVKEPLIFHCDRGCQYVSEAFRQSDKGYDYSYSKKAYPWDNAYRILSCTLEAGMD